jgi:hypothetical protein
MSQAARNLVESDRQEFWKPVETVRHTHADACGTCGTEFPVGARYCYVCGSERETPEEAARTSTQRSWTRFVDVTELMSVVGLSASSLVAFFVGMVCLVAAACVGFIYTATTLLDWQAVQLWRVEWLLAAIAAFAAGVLLKR